MTGSLDRLWTARVPCVRSCACEGLKFQEFMQKILIFHRLWKMFLLLPQRTKRFDKYYKIAVQKLCILLVSNPLRLALKNDII